MGNTPLSVAKDCTKDSHVGEHFAGAFGHPYASAFEVLTENYIFQYMEFTTDDVLTKTQKERYKITEKTFTLDNIIAKRLCECLTVILKQPKYKSLVKNFTLGQTMYLQKELVRSMAAHIVDDLQAALTYTEVGYQKVIPVREAKVTRWGREVLHDLDPCSKDQGVRNAIAKSVALDVLPKVYSYTSRPIEKIVEALVTGINISKAQTDSTRVDTLSTRHVYGTAM